MHGQSWTYFPVQQFFLFFLPIELSASIKMKNNCCLNFPCTLPFPILYFIISIQLTMYLVHFINTAKAVLCFCGIHSSPPCPALPYPNLPYPIFHIVPFNPTLPHCTPPWRHFLLEGGNKWDFNLRTKNFVWQNS